MVNPLAPHVLVPSPGRFLAIRDAAATETSAGIVIAKGATPDPRTWTVFAVGPSLPTENTPMPSVGDKVFMASFAGINIDLPDVLSDILNRVKIFSQSDVLARVTQ